MRGRNLLLNEEKKQKLQSIKKSKLFILKQTKSVIIIIKLLSETRLEVNSVEEKLTIRMAPTDQSDIDALHKYIYKLGRYQKMAETSVTITKETLKEQIGNKTLESVIAFLDDEPVGIGLFYTLASGFTGRTSMFLNIYYVEENLRGKGIGKAIMAYLSKISLERGYERIEWLCLNWNEPSLRFYRGIQSREIDTVITFRLMPDDMKRLNEEVKA